jgi:hypothetical protein
MIYTRFGTPIKVVRGGEIWVRIEYSDGHQRDFLRCELKADGGAVEIEEAIENASLTPEQVEALSTPLDFGRNP